MLPVEKTLNNDETGLRNSVPVPEWLSARYLLRTLNDDVIVSCFDKILETFQGKKEIIGHLVRAANTEQLKYIIEILKSAQLKHIEENDNLIMVNYNDNNSYFDYLSNESILNICEFLNVKDIKQFKMTSTLISLNVFEIMKTYKIGVINMNELIIHNEYKYRWKLIIHKQLKENRIKPFNKNKSLINMYSKRYDIPMDQMLVLSLKRGNRTKGVIADEILKDIIKFNQQQIEKQQGFYIFDERKILILNNTNKLKIMREIHEALKMRGYQIVLLQYFDLNQQRTQNIQFLWFEKSTTPSRIEKYILNDLYSVYNKLYIHQSMDWCHQLLYTINKMKEFGSHPNVKLLKFYVRVNQSLYVGFEIDSKRDKELKEMRNLELMTFELNSDHPFFKAQSEKLNLCQPYYGTIINYTKDQLAKYKVRASCVNDRDLLKTQILFYDNTFNEESIATDFILFITPQTRSEMIRQQIAMKFNNILPVNHIRIGRKFGCSEWDHNFGALRNDKLIIEYDWEIVGYDVNEMQHGKLYKISIYEPDASEYLSTFTFPSKVSQSLFIMYNNFDVIKGKKIKNDKVFRWDKEPSHNWKSTSYNQLSFDVDDFVQNAMNIMSHPMYNGEYDGITKKYENKDTYSVIILNKDDKTTDFRCFDINDEYIHYEAKDEIDIALIGNIICNDNDEKKLDEEIAIIIRFSQYSLFKTKIGYPKRVWITRECKVEDAMNKCIDMKTYNFEFHSCTTKYGAINKDEIIYQRFKDLNGSTIEILITLTQNKRDHSNLFFCLK